MASGFVTLAVFLAIPGFSGGSASLYSAVRCLCLHRPAGGRISAFIISLLLSDALELILIPFALDILLGKGNFNKDCVSAALISLRLCGICFHQLVALEGILALTAHHWSLHLSTRLCAIISFFLWVGILIVCFVPCLWIIGYILYAVAGVVAVISGAIVCKTINFSESSSLEPAAKVLAFALTTFCILYSPVCFMIGIKLIEEDTVVMLWPISIMSFRLIADPLLCMVVYSNMHPIEPTPRVINI